MNEFLALAALIVLAATGTGLLIAGVAHYAMATDPTHGRTPHRSVGRPAKDED